MLMRNGQEFLSRVEKFGGASAGVLVASVLSVRGVDEEALQVRCRHLLLLLSNKLTSSFP